MSIARPTRPRTSLSLFISRFSTVHLPSRYCLASAHATNPSRRERQRKRERECRFARVTEGHRDHRSSSCIYICTAAASLTTTYIYGYTGLSLAAGYSRRARTLFLILGSRATPRIFADCFSPPPPPSRQPLYPAARFEMTNDVPCDARAFFLFSLV